MDKDPDASITTIIRSIENTFLIAMNEEIILATNPLFEELEMETLLSVIRILALLCSEVKSGKRHMHLHDFHISYFRIDDANF